MMYVMQYSMARVLQEMCVSHSSYAIAHFTPEQDQFRTSVGSDNLRKNVNTRYYNIEIYDNHVKISLNSGSQQT